MVEGKLQREGEVIHVVVKRCYNLSRLLNRLSTSELSLDRARPDETTSPFLRNDKSLQENKIIQAKIFPEGRNFK